MRARVRLAEVAGRRDNARPVPTRNPEISFPDARPGGAFACGRRRYAIAGGALRRADGSRLAICFHDGTVKLWDTRNWQVVERLQCEDAGWLYSITFDPQGRRLACGSTAGTIWLWDTDRLTTRTVATTAARVLRLEAEPLVARLFGDGGSAVEVIDRLADEPDISAEVRSAALRLVRTRAGSPAELFRTAWEIVCDPNAATGPYERARAIGVSLLRFHPNDTRYLTAVGLSQFRLGDYHSSRAALLLARKVDASTNPQTDAASRAFLAMTYFKLGELAEAEAELAQLANGHVSNPKPQTSRCSRSGARRNPL